jgi:hypothetical protein
MRRTVFAPNGRQCFSAAAPHVDRGFLDRNDRHRSHFGG